MNNNFFEFTVEPFKKIPATKNFFETKTSLELLTIFTEFLKNDASFAILTGANGVGKTSFVNYLISKNINLAKFIYMQFPFISAEELIEKLIEDLTQSTNTDIHDYDKNQAYTILNKILIQTSNSHKQIVIIIDEAQILNIETLHALRVLSNMIYNNTHLIKVILIAEPSLLKILESKELSTVSQNISLYATLNNMQPADVEKFIRYEIAKSGSKKINISASLIKRITKLSSGNPLLINIYMERVLSSALITRSHNLTLKHLTIGLKASNYSIKNKNNSKLVKRIFSDVIIVLIILAIIHISYQHIVNYDVISRIQTSITGNYAKVVNDNDNDNDDENILPPDDITESNNTTVAHQVNHTPIKPATANPQIINNGLEATINARSLNVRSEPDATATVISSYKQNDTVKVILFDDNWVEINLPDGRKGYMSKEFISIK